MIGRLARFALLALDARAVPRGAPTSRAIAARWIAANALAAGGVQVAFEGPVPRGPRVFALRAPSFAAAIAAVPVLVDADTLPRGWRLALCALGLPLLDRTPELALAQGASVLSAGGSAACALTVELESEGYRVRVGPPDRILVA